MKTKNSDKQSVFEIVSTRFIESLEKGILPWQKPWTDAGLPWNLVTGRPYRCVNVWLLAMLGYEQNLFLNLKQVNDLGSSLKKGEQPYLVVDWHDNNINEIAANEKVMRPFLKYSWVFNIAQCEGLLETMIPVISPPKYPIEACEDIEKNMPNAPEIKQEVRSAFYHPRYDYVNMPPRELFVYSDDYYMTLFTQLIHSTGHISRLNRKDVMDYATFGAETFSIENLTAEIGACYLMSLTGIDVTDFKNNTVYCDGWIQKLKADSHFIFLACAQAQRAVEYILNTNQIPQPKVAGVELTGK